MVSYIAPWLVSTPNQKFGKNSGALQSRKAVRAYSKSKPLLPSGFTWQCGPCYVPQCVSKQDDPLVPMTVLASKKNTHKDSILWEAL